MLGGAMGGVLLSMAMATARPSRAEEAEEADGFAKDYSNYTSGAAPAAEEQSELVKVRDPATREDGRPRDPPNDVHLWTN